MTLITNYLPNPRWQSSGARLSKLTGCTVSYASNYPPANSTWPGMTLTASRDGDNWGEMNVSLPAGASLAMIASSSYPASASQSGSAMSLWDSTGTKWLVNLPAGWAKSVTFTVPANGIVKLTFRAPKTNGDHCNLMCAGIYDPTAVPVVSTLPGSWFDGNLMPLG